MLPQAMRGTRPTFGTRCSGRLRQKLNLSVIQYVMNGGKVYLEHIILTVKNGGGSIMLWEFCLLDPYLVEKLCQYFKIDVHRHFLSNLTELQPLDVQKASRDIPQKT
ncbi:hypothetical protein ATANTOWER_002141 [Ataeniobius toweri]|uniref:Uncharacterized protein n=1 Tax=Ataeniobius toweri TaxID=208326 RepID=A0ABU7BG79_9TELE|nr:hypothetical protein [Ataeniobius toweri]